MSPAENALVTAVQNRGTLAGAKVALIQRLARKNDVILSPSGSHERWQEIIHSVLKLPSAAADWHLSQ